MHNVVFKFPIVEEPKVEVDWRKVRMQNWGRLIGSVCGLTVEKTSSHVLIYPDVLVGDDPWRLLFLARDEAEWLKTVLESKFGMKLGKGELCRKPHFGVYDPVASRVSSFYQLSDDVGKIDESEGYGEIDWTDPEAAKEYLLMPLRIKELLNRLTKLESGLLQIFQTWNVIGNRLLEILPSTGDPTKCRICGRETWCSRMSRLTGFTCCTLKTRPDQDCINCPQRLCKEHLISP